MLASFGGKVGKHQWWGEGVRHIPLHTSLHIKTELQVSLIIY